MLAQILIVAGYTALFFAVSAVVKKTGGAIAACIVAPMLVSLVLSLINSLLNINGFALSDYWLDGLFASAASGERLVTAIILSVVYCAAFCAAGVFISKKQEV